MKEKKHAPNGGRSGRLVLEILAIFIGITASFWVEEWREERQDTEIFHRLLGEIYFNLMMDQEAMVSVAAQNNLALTWASELVIREQPLPPAPELFHRLQTIFGFTGLILNTGGRERLTNTPLAIPVNDIQLALDQSYNILEILADSTVNQGGDVVSLGNAHWWSRGIIPCNDPLANTPSQPDRMVQLDLAGQAAPLTRAVGTPADCLSDEFNQQAAVDAMASEDFRIALRQVINIRQRVAGTLMGTRLLADFLREQLVTFYPDIGLPVESVHILGSATEVEWKYQDAIALRRVGPNDWVGDVTLGEGAIKFLANREWIINWGGKPPWVASGVAGEGSFSASNVDREAVFPAGRAHLNGMDIPVRPGRYRVHFNTQDFEYRFEPVSP